MKKRFHFLAFVGAVLLHAGILLFGGLLLFSVHGKKTTVVEDVAIDELKKDDDKKADKEEKKEEKIASEKEAPPEAPPDLADAPPPPLSLDSLEASLSTALGDVGGGDFAMARLGAGGGARAAAADLLAVAASEANAADFSLSDLDQPPRPTFQPPPEYPGALRKQKLTGTVQLLFVVGEDGRVNNPIVQKSTHPAFDQPALQAVRRWRFEPGKRNGKPVAFKMRVPITFKSR